MFINKYMYTGCFTKRQPKIFGHISQNTNDHRKIFFTSFNLDIQVPTQFMFSFPQRPPPTKIANQKKFLKYQKFGRCLNLNKTRSGTRIMVRTEGNITVVQQSLEMIKVS